MQAIQILDVKQFMQLLFQSQEFHSYDFVSGEIRSDMKYQLDGHWNSDFFSTEEQEQYQLTDRTYLPWEFSKDRIFQLIKGRKTPSFMKLVLRLDNTQTQALLSQNKQFTSQDIDGLFVNITFQSKKLNVICGISYKIFTIDKALESDFYNYFVTFLKSKTITHE